jgi:hypothetical protein
LDFCSGHGARCDYGKPSVKVQSNAFDPSYVRTSLTKARAGYCGALVWSWRLTDLSQH